MSELPAVATVPPSIGTFGRTREGTILAAMNRFEAAGASVELRRMRIGIDMNSTLAIAGASRVVSAQSAVSPEAVISDTSAVAFVTVSQEGTYKVSAISSHAASGAITGRGASAQVDLCHCCCCLANIKPTNASTSGWSIL